MLGLSQPWGFRAPERLFWIFVCWDLAVSPGIQGVVSFLEKGSLEGRGAAGLFALPLGCGGSKEGASASPSSLSACLCL